MTIGQKIKEMRLELNLTLEEVANLVGVSKPTVLRWENGDIESMRADKIEKLANALKTTPAYLMGWINDTTLKPDKTFIDEILTNEEKDAIGQRIKGRRKEKRLTQDDLAKSANTTKQTIFKYENSIVTNIPTDKLLAIAKRLDCTPSYLLGWDNEPHRSNKTESIGDILTEEEKEDLALLRELSPLARKSLRETLRALIKTDKTTTDY